MTSTARPTAPALAALLALLVAGLVAAGCGSDEDGDRSAGRDRATAADRADDRDDEVGRDRDEGDEDGEAARGADEPEPRPGPVALEPGSICTVVGLQVPRASYDRLLQQARRRYTDAGQGPPKPGSAADRTLRDDVLDLLLTTEVMRHEAERLGIEVTSAQVERKFAQLLRSTFGGDMRRLRAELRRSGMTEAGLREQLRQQEVEERLHARVTQDLEPTDEEVREYYEENEQQFRSEESRKVAHILVGDRALAARLAAQLRAAPAGSDLFARLAKQHSTDVGSAENGGTLDVTRGQTVPEFDDVAFSLDTNGVSAPVKTQFGWHVITALGPVKPARAEELDYVRDDIRDQLRQTAESERFGAWRRDVIARAAETHRCAPGVRWTAAPARGLGDVLG